MKLLSTTSSFQRSRGNITIKFAISIALMMLIPLMALPQKKNKKKEKTKKEQKDTGKKILICHKGKTIEVSQSALNAHLKHGDLIGSCFEGNLDGDVMPFFEYEEKVDEEIGVELTWLKEEYERQGGVPSDDIFTVKDDKVLIEIIASDASYLGSIQSIIEGYGAEVFADYLNEDDIIITSFFPIDYLDALNADLNAGTDVVAFARAIPRPVLGTGIITNQGDRANQSEGARAAFGIDGFGTTVCVISDSYNALGKANASIANGDIPSDVLVIQDYEDAHFNVVDEGLAMLEIIHDGAPGAGLAFRTGFNSMEDMAIAYAECEIAGCDIITDDVTHLFEPFYTDGLINMAIDEATSNGVRCYSSAGNFADKGYEGIYNPDPTDPSYHNFGYGGINQRVRFDQPGIYVIGFQYNDVYKSVGGVSNNGALNDLDISLVDLNGNNLVTLNTNNIGKDPIEIMSVRVENAGAEAFLKVRKAAGPDNPEFKYVVFVGGQHFSIVSQVSSTSTIVGHANSTSGNAVGAAYHEQTPAFDGSVPVAESFSSKGGMMIDGIDRQKPDFLAADGGNISQFTGVGVDTDDPDPFPNFFGTSAAAPLAAAVDALVAEAQTKFDVEAFDIPERMKTTALDIGATGYDNLSGAGFILADLAILSFAAAKPGITQLEVPEGTAIGEEVFDVTINGNYFNPGTIIILDDTELPVESVSFVNSKTLVASIPEFPPVNNGELKVFNASITPSGLDGGTSDPYSLFYEVKPALKVIAIDTNRLFGEYNPEFTSRILVDDVPLSESGLPQAEIDAFEAMEIVYETSGDRWDNPAGIYYIRPIEVVAGSVDPILLENYDIVFQDGYLTVDQLPMMIIPDIPESYVYGEVIDINSYTYDLYSDGVDDNENIVDLDALLEYIDTEYKSTFPEDVTNAIVDRARILVNRARILVNEYGWLVTESALANRARILVNGSILIDVDIDLVTDYQDNPDGTISDRARILVNGESLFSGQAGLRDELGNRARILVNEGGLGSSDNESDDFSNVTIIADSLDYVITQLYSVNLISGLEVNHPEEPRQYAVPGAYVAPSGLNFQISYLDKEFDILPAQLQVDVHDQWILNGDLPPENSVSISGFTYEDKPDDEISDISFDPINYTGVGSYDIVPTIDLSAPSNYVLEQPISPGTLRVVNESDLRFLVTTDQVELIESNGNSSGFITSNSRSVEVTQDFIYTLETPRVIAEFNHSGEALRSISIPAEVTYYLDFSVLPNGDFALFDNSNDKIYFIDSEGNYLETVNVLENPDNELQFLNGVVVNNALIFSETGLNQLLKIDLNTYEVSIFRDLSHLTDWLGAIDYYDGMYYFCQSRAIWSFSEGDQTETLISTFPQEEFNITGINVAGNFAYITLNFAGGLYKVNLTTGERELLSGGLDYPEDVEILLPSTAVYYEIDLDTKYIEDLRSIDIDNDGTDELLVLTNLKGSDHEGEINLYKWINDEFQPIWTSNIYDGYPYGLKVYDMDQDGNDDFLFTYDAIRLFTYDPQVVFISQNIIGDYAQEVMGIDDFDGDEDWDIIYGGPGDNSGYMKYYKQSDQNSFDYVMDFTDGIQGNNYVERIDLGDADPGIVNMELYSGNVYVYQNLGNNSFTQYFTYSFGTRTFSLAVADFDNDEDDDFIISEWNTKIHFFRKGSNDFAIGYSSPTDIGTTYNTQAIDINEDGWMDLVAATLSGDLYLYLNKQNFVFEELKANIDQVVDGNYGLAVADFDGDNKYDVALGYDPVIIHFDILSKFEIPVQQAALRMATFDIASTNITDPGSVKESTTSEGNEWYVPEVGDGNTLVEGNIKIFPIPVLDMLTIVHANTSIESSDIIVNAYDNQGNPVQINSTITQLNEGFSMNLSSLATGIYYLHVSDGSTTEIFRIQKN